MFQQPGFTGEPMNLSPCFVRTCGTPLRLLLWEKPTQVSLGGVSVSIVLMMSTSLLKIMLSTTLTWRNQMDHITHRQGPVQIANAENLHQVTRLEFFTKTATEKATKV